MAQKKSHRRRRRMDRGPKPPASTPLQRQQAKYLHVLESDERRLEVPGWEQDGNPCPEVLLDGPEVKEYADFVSMRMDFDHVITMCEYHDALIEDSRVADFDHMPAIRSTWEAAVIAYGRAFVSGASAVRGAGSRARVPVEVLNGLTPAQQEVHDRTLGLRNKHVGHRVNDWTQVLVTVVLRPDIEGKRGVLNVANRVVTVVSGGESAAQLREVAIILRDGLNERLNSIEADLSTQYKAKSIDDLYEAARIIGTQAAQLMEMERQRQASGGTAPQGMSV